MMMKRKFLLTIFIALSGLYSNYLFGSHLMGGEVTYTFLGEDGASPNVNRYKITFNLYTWCGAGSSFPTPPSSISVGVYHVSNGNEFASYYFGLSRSRNITPNLADSCSVSGLDGFCAYYATYEQEIRLPVSFSGFYVAYQECCRNGDIVNLSGPSGLGQTIYTKIPPTAYKNNSPAFSDTLVPYLCKGKLTSLINTATDPDGDRLVYSFTNPYDQYSTPFFPPPTSAPYASGYSVATPFGAGGYTYINASSGLTTYSAPNNGNYVLSIQIKEYRTLPNGTDVLLNTTSRELQFIVGDCPTTTTPIPAGSTANDSVFNVNAGSNLCFNVAFSDPSGDNLVLTKNGNPLGNNPGGDIFSAANFSPPATLPNTSGTGFVSSQFCWNTTCSQAGTYNFRVNVKDNGCPPTTVYKDYIINVLLPPPGSISGPSSVCPNQTGVVYSVPASTGNTFQWTITGGTQTSGGNTNSITVNWGNGTTGNVSVVKVNSNGCASAPVNLPVTMQTIAASAGADVAICPGDSVTLTATGGTSYSWTPTNTLSSPNTATTIAKPTVTTNYVVSVTNSSGCVKFDTVVVSVTTPVANAGADKSICSGSSATLGTSSTTSYTYSWSPITGLSSSTVSNPTATLTNAGTSPATTTYTVTATINSCSRQDQVIVTVKPLPVSNAGADASICSGGSASLGASSTTGYTYSWSPITGLSSSTASNPSVTLTNSGTTPVTSTYTVTTTLNGCSTQDQVAVTVKPLPVSNAGSDVSICSGGSATLGTNSTTGYTYSWSPVTGLSNSTVSNPTVTLTNAGTAPVTSTYTVTTTLNGCTSQDLVIVTVKQLPVSNAGSDVSICSGSASTLGTTSSSGHTYSWTPITGLSSSTVSNPTVTLTNTGSSPVTSTYTVTTTLNACTSQDQVVVTVKPLPVSNAGTDVSFCSGSSATLGTSVTTGYTYSWSPITGLSSSTSSNPTVTLTNSGTTPVTSTYTVTTTLNGCTTQDQVLVTVKPLPISNAGSDVSFCSGASATLGTTTTTGYTYSWSPITGLSNSTVSNPTVTLTNTGTSPVTSTYTVTTTLAGCTTQDQVIVTIKPLPVSNAGSDVSFCSGSSATLGTSATSGYTYSWSPITGLSSSTSSNPTVTLTNSGTTPVTSTYTVTTTLNGCSTQDQVWVTVKPLPISNAGSDVSFCSGASSTLGTTATTGYTYSWSPITGLSNSTVSNPTVTLTNSGTTPVTSTYTVTTTLAGCTTQDQVIVTVKPLPVSNAGSDVSFCSGGSSTLGTSATTGYTYSWSPITGLSSSTVSNPTVTLTNTGTTPVTSTYTVTTTLNGCSTQDQVIVTIKPLPVSNAGSDVSFCSGDTVEIGSTFTAGYTYSWSPITGLSSSTVSNPSLTLTNAGTTPVTTTYTVTTTLNGCITQDQIVVTVKPLPISNAGADISFCSGGSSTLGVSSTTGHTYSWSPITGLSSSTVSNPTITLTNTGTTPVTTTYTVTSTLNGCSTQDQVVVTVRPLPVSNAGADVSFCSGDTVNIGSGSVTGYTYSWTPITGLSNSTISNPTLTLINTGTTPVTSTYTVTTTLNGCTTQDQIVVTVRPLPISSAGSDVSFCSGSTETLGASSTTGYTYSWSPITGLSSSTVSNPTVTLTNTATTPVTSTYTVTTTLNGCTTQDQVLVTVKPLPISNAGIDMSFCSGGSATLGASSTTGYTYSWSPITGLNSSTTSNPIVTLTNAGTTPVTSTYTVTTTLNGCSTQDQVVVTVKPLPVSNAGPDVSFCSGDTAMIGSTSTSSYTYSWSPTTGLSGSTESNPTVTLTNTGTTPISTTYTVSTTLDGCITQDQVIVTIKPLPISNAGSDISFCSGDTANIGSASTTGYTYSWSPIIGLSNSTVSDPTITLTNSDTIPLEFNYTIITTLNGCITQDSVKVTVNELPTIIVNDAWICPGSSTTLSASGGVSYNWSPSTGLNDPSIASPIASPSVTTSYIVSVTGSNGCINTDTSIVEVGPIVPVQAGSDRAICFGDSTLLGGSPTSPSGSTYSWSPSAGINNSNIANPIAQPDSTTIYIVTVSNDTCSGVDTVIVNVNPLPYAIVGLDTSICLGSNIVLGSDSIIGHTYTWSSNPSGFSSSSSEITVTPSVSTTFYLTEIDTVTGCSKTDSVNIVVWPLPDAFTANDTSICDGESIFIGADSIPGNTYSWSSFPVGFSSSLSNPEVTPLVTTTYYLTETIYATGCNKMDSIYVIIKPIPSTPVVQSNSPVCEGDTIKLSAVSGSGGNYSWNGPNNFVSSEQNPVVLNSTILDGGYYFVTTTVDGCTSPSDSTLVTIHQNAIVNAGSDQLICIGTDTIALSGTITGGNNSFIWSTLGSGSFQPGDNILNTNYVLSAADSIAGTVTLVLSSTNNTACAASSDTIVIRIGSIPVVNAGRDQSVCSYVPEIFLGGSVMGGAGTGMWTTIDGSGAFNIDTANFITYIPSPSDVSNESVSFVLTSTNSCVVKEDTITVTFLPVPTADFSTMSNNYYIGQSINFTDESIDPYSWYWIFGTLPFTSTIQNPVYSFMQIGTHPVTLIVTNEFGCRDTIIKDIQIDQLPVAVPSGFTPNGDNVNDVLYVKGGPLTQLEFKIYNEWGNLIYTSLNQKDGWDGTYKGVLQPTGVFIYTVNGVTVNGDSVKFSGQVNLLH